MGCGGSKREPRPAGGLKVERAQTAKDVKVLEAKVVLLGDTGVGKSSIAMRFSQDKFPSAHEVTIGGAYFQHQVALANGNTVKLHIWDTGGADRFRAMTHIYYKDAVASILVYDITNSKTLNAVKFWVDELNSHNDPKKMVLALAANKADLAAENADTIMLGKRYAEENGMIFRETSAKTGIGVSELFRQLVEAVYAKLTNN